MDVTLAEVLFEILVKFDSVNVLWEVCHVDTEFLRQAPHKASLHWNRRQETFGNKDLLCHQLILGKLGPRKWRSPDHLQRLPLEQLEKEGK